MVGVERIVPIIKVTDLHTALNFYCSVLGFDEDSHYRASPDGPDYVGVSLNGHQLHLSTFSGDGKGLATIMGSAGSVCSGPGWPYASVR